MTDRDVFLLPAQLSEAVLKGAEKPSLLIVALLEVFFSYEVLAASKAKGTRTAHNKKIEEDTQPLPFEVTSAINSWAWTVCICHNEDFFIMWLIYLYITP